MSTNGEDYEAVNRRRQEHQHRVEEANLKSMFIMEGWSFDLCHRIPWSWTEECTECAAIYWYNRPTLLVFEEEAEMVLLR